MHVIIEYHISSINLRSFTTRGALLFRADIRPSTLADANVIGIWPVVAFAASSLFRAQHQVCDGPEHLLDVDVLLGRRLEQLDVHL